MKGSVADDGALSMVHIKNRREAEIDPACTQLCCQNISRLMCQVPCTDGVLIPYLTQFSHGRQSCEILAEALNSATFMVYRDQEWRAA